VAYTQECDLSLTPSNSSIERYKKSLFSGRNNNTTELSNNRIRRVVHSHTITLLISLSDYCVDKGLRQEISRTQFSRRFFWSFKACFYRLRPKKGSHRLCLGQFSTLQETLIWTVHPTNNFLGRCMGRNLYFLCRVQLSFLQRLLTVCLRPALKFQDSDSKSFAIPIPRHSRFKPLESF
jgi:hypothetical protein